MSHRALGTSPRFPAGDEGCDFVVSLRPDDDGFVPTVWLQIDRMIDGVQHGNGWFEQRVTDADLWAVVERIAGGGQS